VTGCPLAKRDVFVEIGAGRLFDQLAGLLPLMGDIPTQ